MPEPQGWCEYGGFTNLLLGGSFTHSRGATPSVVQLSLAAEPATTRFVGTLTLHYGTTAFTFANCATASHVQQTYHGRTPYTWILKVYDKRWRWRYPRVSGTYNVRLRDGTLDANTRTSLQDLLTILLNELGESVLTLRNIPDVYPEVHWLNAYAARELEQLCDWAGLVICPQLDGSILVERLSFGEDLPNSTDNISPPYSHTQSVLPSVVELHTAPTVFQSVLTLEAVGLDTDGTIKPIDNLSYKPAAGWSSQWYTTFGGVAAANRHLAFQSVWRWYRIAGQDVESDGLPTDMTLVELLTTLADSPRDNLDIPRCLDPVVKGVFWPLCDHKANTTATVRYSGPFHVNPANSLIAFDYPVIRWDANGAVAAPTLKLYVSYHAQDSSGALQAEQFIQAVPQASVTTAPRVERRPYLSRVKRTDSPYVAISSTEPLDNLATVSSESLRYLNSVVETYSAGPARDMLYAGLLPLNLSGKIAQVGWQWGRERVATTRASTHHEWDTSTDSHQQRRRQERLGQLYDRVLES